MEDQREKFEVFIRVKHIDGDSKKSKTVAKAKLQKITNCATLYMRNCMYILLIAQVI